ncbi:hypothetical protein B0H10DRAFT_2233548 [Mycena sp. CBHHK59/15]|nr:hypothetical protein B0H10DRAFT_2233548 [Mycena sp. CBHHK59/15]
MTSLTETSSKDDLSFWNSRHLEFRVLILGRANAGKTTILERLTEAAMDEAEVRRKGKVLPGQTIRGQSDRGLHNVEDEIRFPSRPGFVFHDSRGFEAGSSEQLSIVQQFVETRSSATDLREQLHAIWMCRPLDDSREFEKEKEPLRWSKGLTPLVVIFTKRDGAVSKETSQIIKEKKIISRAGKKEARAMADSQVTNRVNELEGELRQLSLANGAVAFLTTSGMEERTVDTEKACQQLIDLTEECLSGPTVKTLLSTVWGRNLSRRGFWCFYW